jgi:hypothetical protein
VGLGLSMVLIFAGAILLTVPGRVLALARGRHHVH